MCRDSLRTRCLECLATEPGPGAVTNLTSYRLPVMPYMVPGAPPRPWNTHLPFLCCPNMILGSLSRLWSCHQHPLDSLHCTTRYLATQALEQSLTPYRLPVLPFLISGDPSQALQQLNNILLDSLYHPPWFLATLLRAWEVKSEIQICWD